MTYFIVAKTSTCYCGCSLSIANTSLIWSVANIRYFRLATPL